MIAVAKRTSVQSVRSAQNSINLRSFSSNATNSRNDMFVTSAQKKKMKMKIMKMKKMKMETNSMGTKRTFQDDLAVSRKVVNEKNERLEQDLNFELLSVAVMVGVTTGLAVSLFNVSESLLHAQVFDFTFKQFLVGEDEKFLVKEFGVSDAFASKALQVVVPLVGGVCVSVLREVSGGFIGEEYGGSTTAKAQQTNVRVVVNNSNDESDGNINSTTASVVEGTGQAMNDAKKTLLKTTAAVVTLGTGASLGPEGPSVELGAAVASGVGRIAEYFQLKAFNSSSRNSSGGSSSSSSSSSSSRTNNSSTTNISGSVGDVGLLAAGAAAGLAAGFGAPIAGVFFGFESVLARNSTTFGNQQFNNASTTEMVIVAAVLAGTVTNLILGESPSFDVPPFELLTLAELPLYLPLGLLCGATAILFRGVSNRATDLASFCSTSHAESGFGIPRYAQAPLGGFVLGVVSIYYPEVSYNGFDNVNALLTTDVLQIYKPELLIQLVAAKLFATSLCRSAGLVGGVYAPSLFMGAALGASYGGFLASLNTMHFGSMQMVSVSSFIAVAPPQAYALVGMAGVLASVCRVPLTAILLLFELTGNAKIILPLMGTVGVASWAVKYSDAWLGGQQSAGLIFDDSSIDASIDDEGDDDAKGDDDAITLNNLLIEDEQMIHDYRTCAKVIKTSPLKDVAKQMVLYKADVDARTPFATTAHAIVYNEYIEESKQFKNPIGAISVVDFAKKINDEDNTSDRTLLLAKDIMEPIFTCVISHENTLEKNMNKLKQSSYDIGVLLTSSGDVKAIIDLRELTLFDSCTRVRAFANE